MLNHALIRGRHVSQSLRRTTHGPAEVSGLQLLRNLCDPTAWQMEL